VKIHLIWFSSHKEIGIFTKWVIGTFHPSFDSKGDQKTQRTIPPSFYTAAISEQKRISFMIVDARNIEVTKAGRKGPMTCFRKTLFSS